MSISTPPKYFLKETKTGHGTGGHIIDLVHAFGIKGYTSGYGTPDEGMFLHIYVNGVRMSAGPGKDYREQETAGLARYIFWSGKVPDDRDSVLVEVFGVE